MALKRVFLVGFMGSGKSTIGRRLAADLGWDFVDMDRYIEKSEGSTITQIFAEQGEATFRQIEVSALRTLTNKERVVIATGGGTPCHASNADLMHDNGLMLYISVAPTELARRLSHNRSRRPLIAQKSDSELLDYIKTTLAQREPFYKKAHVTIDGVELPFERYADVVRGYERY